MPRSPSIAAVSLDVGGTLIEPWPSVGHVYADVVRSFGCPEIDPARLTAAFGKAWRLRKRFDYSRAAWRGLVERSFGEVCEFAVTEACFTAIFERFAEAEAWRMFDDVRPLLEALRSRGVAVALVSNWDERLRPLLGKLGLASAASAIVVSHEVGHAKPAVEIFAKVAAVLDLPPAEILHVGDSEQEDFLGATGAGMKALWLRRTGGAGPGRIRSLAEVVSSIDAGRQGVAGD